MCLSLRMRLAILLVFFFTLMFSDGFDNDLPCQRRWDNNAYNIFQNRHILQQVFDTNSQNAWANYLTRMRLCGREARQSFIQKDEENRIIEICTSRGYLYSGNMCISSSKFTVFIVKSKKTDDGWCEVQVQTQSSYVIVACEIVVNQCLPVHYGGQIYTPRKREPCRPWAW